MQAFEYKVIPAPKKAAKAKGVKTAEGRFANALQILMNELGAEGWEYQRTDTLPCEERQGLRGKTTNFQNMLIFRRALVAEARLDEAENLVSPAPQERVAETLTAEAADLPATETPEAETPETDAPETERDETPRHAAE